MVLLYDLNAHKQQMHGSVAIVTIILAYGINILDQDTVLTINLINLYVTLPAATGDCLISTES